MDILARWLFIFNIKKMTNVIDEVTPTLDGAWIQEAAKPTNPQADAAGDGGSAKGNWEQPQVTQPTPPQTSNEPEVPNTEGEATMWTVDDLLKEQMTKESLEALENNEQKILDEIWVEVDKKTTEDTQPPTPQNNDKGDEPSHGFEQQLKEIKMHATTKVAEAQDAQFRAETLMEQNQKKHSVEKELLEQKIAELSSENLSLKQESIPKDDEALVTYNYLRSNFKENKEDPQWAQKLGKFHLNFAANYFNVPKNILDEMVVWYHNRKQRQQDAMSSWYSRTWWGGVSTDIQYGGEQLPPAPVKELLN